MSKIFYDPLIILEIVEKKLNKHLDSHQQKLEIWEIIDNLIHNRFLNKILEILPEKHHSDFLLNFNKAPHDPSLLEFLKEKSPDIENYLSGEAENLTEEILDIIESNLQ